MSTRSGGNRGAALSTPKPRATAVPKAAASSQAGRHSPALARALDTIESAIVHQQREHLYVLAADGSTVFTKIGDRSGVNTTDAELAQMRAQTVTHNHPRGTSFSPADVRIAATYQFTQMRAVGAKYRYTLTPPPGGWNERTWDEVIRPRFRRHDREVGRQFTAEIYAGRLTLERADLLHNHEVWTRVARETGIGYRRSSWHPKRGASGEG